MSGIYAGDFRVPDQKGTGSKGTEISTAMCHTNDRIPIMWGFCCHEPKDTDNQILTDKKRVLMCKCQHPFCDTVFWLEYDTERNPVAEAIGIYPPSMRVNRCPCDGKTDSCSSGSG